MISRGNRREALGRWSHRQKEGDRVLMAAVGPMPRRLIEIDLPISSISKHARDGRSVHHGHITAIHIWWARKPLPSCRAAILAATLIDPASSLAPEGYRAEAAAVLAQIYGDEGLTAHDIEGLHRGLLRFVSEFSSWK